MTLTYVLHLNHSILAFPFLYDNVLAIKSLVIEYASVPT